MRNIFSPDNPVMLFITKLVYCVYLNILWFVCCIPIVTAGASTTALFTVTLKMVKDEEGSITAQFFQAFKKNFKQSTIVWGILLIGGIVLAVDGYVLYHLRFENKFWTLLTAVFFVVVLIYAVICMYVFPLMAYFENTIFAMLKNSLFIGMHFLLCTAAMAAVYFIMVLIVVRFFTPAVIFGEGLCAYLCSCLLKGVLEKCSPVVEDNNAADTLE
ncbi:MAG: YesL family protein [Blautia sp.]|nr:YesL family protein [Blautia sp.]